ncbi:hypothetical protein F5887DRAFT_919551 [Amanita rubescens]|nr:hypothetical protein F5887DRAFT_919551 [Amanita rubescens]
MADAHPEMPPILRPPRPAIIGEDKYPPQPHSPLTDDDIVNSWRYLQTVDGYRGYTRLGSADFANANKYHAQVTAAHMGFGANAGIEQLLLDIQGNLRRLATMDQLNQLAEGVQDEIRQIRQDLARIDQRVERIDQRVEQTDRKVDQLKDQLNRVEQMSAVICVLKRQYRHTTEVVVMVFQAN